MQVSRIRERLRYDPKSGSFTWDTGRKAGCKKREGYVVIRVDNTLEYAHRIAWTYVHGQWPAGHDPAEAHAAYLIAKRQLHAGFVL